MTSTENFEGAQTAICAHAEWCGGCNYQGVDYEEQLRLKGVEVEKCLGDKEIIFNEYLGIERAPQTEAYRNKMEYTFGDLTKGGEMTLGLHRKKNFMSIVTTDRCRIVCDDFNAILAATLKFCGEKGYEFYNKKRHEGLLRHLILRRGVRTGELLVNIVTSCQGAFHGDEYTGLLRELKLEGVIKGIINTRDDGLADSIQCDETKVLWGRDYYTEIIMGLTFKVGAFSFFQTNVEAAERLYTDAIGMSGGFDGKSVFDLYCGTGTISQAVSGHAKRVVGIDISAESIAGARENADRNGIKNCEFFAGDVFDVMETLRESPDVIILDPPRAGVHPKALKKIVDYGAGELIYISCNPKSFVDNLYYLQYYGYRADKIKAYDNFPFTRHCECLARLVR